MKGRIAFNSKGIVSGVDSLRRLKFATNNNGNWIWGNWLNITKCELVDGTAVVSTQDGDTYTIFAFTTSAFKGQIIKHETEEWKLFQRLGPDRWPR